MYLKIKGLVLRVVVYNDTDALLTLLTHDRGKLTVKARGLRRKNSPLTPVCQLLAYGEYTLFEYRGMYTINEASALELFLPLRKDLLKLSLATYFAQATEVISQEDMPNPALLSLTLNSLFALSKANADERLIKGAFELRLASLAGYTPDLNGCICGDTFPGYFDLTEGRAVCGNCLGTSSQETGIRVPLSPGVLDCMRYICACEGKRLFSFQAGIATLQQLSEITESYLSTQLERGFSALDFYKSLLYEQP